mmetsp:Transcript_3836/g.13527  ORF Transcript_3836/g.13527 Transcript_3836/m.13527 type:complete len:214 (-) Transcript_3836:1131-1772(-)
MHALILSMRSSSMRTKMALSRTHGSCPSCIDCTSFARRRSLAFWLPSCSSEMRLKSELYARSAPSTNPNASGLRLASYSPRIASTASVDRAGTLSSRAVAGAASVPAAAEDAPPVVLAASSSSARQSACAAFPSPDSWSIVPAFCIRARSKSGSEATALAKLPGAAPRARRSITSTTERSNSGRLKRNRFSGSFTVRSRAFGPAIISTKWMHV